MRKIAVLTCVVILIIVGCSKKRSVTSPEMDIISNPVFSATAQTTVTYTHTLFMTATVTATVAVTNSLSFTSTTSPTLTVTRTYTAANTATGTKTPSQTVTMTPEAINTATNTVTATLTMTATFIISATPTVTITETTGIPCPVEMTGNTRSAFMCGPVNTSIMLTLRVEITVTAKVTHLSGYFNSSTTDYALALYSESASGKYADAFITGTDVLNDTDTGWQDRQVNPVTVAPGYYWIAFAQNGNKLQVTDCTDASVYEYIMYFTSISEVAAGGFPANLGSDSSIRSNVPMLAVKYTCP